ncbi:polyphosphate polymerase domain-containing protein [Alkaliphilus peptidifermentans]|uniref:VTC domain-containing protein n=1 Tax=Alkaliphilus peptidifermentans DSM 18978 TaxID=1120976 RepID=A0A1G5AEE3_9FIRM|nr:polyphosphate polymerase domain-containing protein [Alkaliphilus peptidifermentans]SCX76247.1 VTC domain-containing protein [Alkaliphilus peptidifermentans DSM 18978]
MDQEVFNRYEFKYIIDHEKYKKVYDEVKGRLTVDPFGNGEGHYRILSFYYDTPEDTFFHETLNGTVFRQKLRLRAYNNVNPNSDVFLEVKQKHDGVVNKRRTKLPLREAYAFLNQQHSNSRIDHFQASNKQILNEIHFLKNFYELKPKIIISYDRQAFQGVEEKDLRVTFDTDLRKDENCSKIEDYKNGEPIMESGLYVLEVKVNSRIPYWLTRILSECECYKQGVSKYCIGYGDPNDDLEMPAYEAI